MMLVDVVTGRLAVGKSGMKVCPLLPKEQFVRYNSLADNVKSPSIHIIQHSSQAYPLYLLTYH
jgi:hypothetical protein